MYFPNSHVLTVLLLGLTFCLCERTPTTTSIYLSLETFAKNLFKELTHEEAEDGRYSTNLVASPVGVWSLLALVTEGASSNTETQLKSALNLPDNSTVIRRGYKAIKKALLLANGSSATLESGNAIFTDVNRPLLPEFEYTAELHYFSTIRGIDMRNPAHAAEEVNSWVETATHGRIRRLISANDISEAELILANAVFFQGSWSLPFNSTFTVLRPFYADYKPSTESPRRRHSRQDRSAGNEEVVATVPMMHQSGNFKLAFSSILKAQIIELPYEGDRLSMLVILPGKGTPLAQVCANLRSQSIESILQILKAQNTYVEGDEASEFGDESIDVFLPRFSINSQVQLKEPLQKLGIIDLFDPTLSDLSKLAHMRGYVSKVVHRAEIKVAEQGTVASAATVATINNFSMPTVFNANHPFIFIVIEKTTKAIIFAGKVSNPSLT